MSKLYSIAVLVLLSILSIEKVSAQAGVPMSLRGDFNRMQTNFAMQNQMSMQRMMNQPWYFGMDYLINKTYKFKVLMKDSTVKEVKSKIYADTGKHKSYLMFTDKKLADNDPKRYTKIYSDETRSITRADGTTNYEGIATDSCWLFRVIRGNISAYSHLSEVDEINSMYLRAFQIGNGPIQKLDSAALAPVIKTDPKALKAFQKKDYYKAIIKYDGF